MSLESFAGFDSGEAMSAAALEKLQERMRAAAAQIALIRKEEKKQKKKENDLIKILLQFIKKSNKKQLVLLISRVLEQNIPANFILGIVMLGNEEIQKILNKDLLKLTEGTVAEAKDQALIFFDQKDQTLPLKIKIQLDAWMKELIVQAEETPHKLVKTAFQIDYVEIEEDHDMIFESEKKYKEERSIKKILIELTAYVLEDFLKQNSIDEDVEKINEFSEFIIKGILEKTSESLEKRKFLT